MCDVYGLLSGFIKNAFKKGNNRSSVMLPDTTSTWRRVVQHVNGGRLSNNKNIYTPQKQQNQPIRNKKNKSNKTNRQKHNLK